MFVWEKIRLDPQILKWMLGCPAQFAVEFREWGSQRTNGWRRKTRNLSRTARHFSPQIMTRAMHYYCRPHDNIIQYHHCRGLIFKLAQNGYGSIPIVPYFSGMKIHLPAILGFTRGTRVLTHPQISFVNVWYSLCAKFHLPRSTMSTGTPKDGAWRRFHRPWFTPKIGGVSWCI